MPAGISKSALVLRTESSVFSQFANCMESKNNGTLKSTSGYANQKKQLRRTVAGKSRGNTPAATNVTLYNVSAVLRKGSYRKYVTRKKSLCRGIPHNLQIIELARKTKPIL